MKKTVFVFGDSNTWGWKPENDLTKQIERFDDDERWAGVMGLELGSGYRVIVNGLNGRTTVHDDPIEEFRCGAEQIIPSMDAAAIFDLMIIFLGTNDLKVRYTVTAQDIANSAGLLVQKAAGRADDFKNRQPRVILVCPPPIGPFSRDIFREMFGGNEEKSRRFPPYFKAAAAVTGALFFDAGRVIKSSEIDGIHLDADQHAILGEAMASEVKKAIG
ncbi:MAG: SGNH/GDSL hydrolase family protein [Synergistaceae bacterium]|jgi:lysophospholipase L1-like esterase|nr:SGNH/GDSL hydrolase family protein [Synergistaceae bacterium]